MGNPGAVTEAPEKPLTHKADLKAEPVMAVSPAGSSLVTVKVMYPCKCGDSRCAWTGSATLSCYRSDSTPATRQEGKSLIDPANYRVARVEGPAELLGEFRVRELHPGAEIIEAG